MLGKMTSEARSMAIGMATFFGIIVMAGVVLDFLPLVFLPLLIGGALVMLYNLEWPYLLLFATLPLSWEQEFDNGFGSDLPSEPLMIVLMVLAFLYILRHAHRISASMLLHVISLALVAHYAWLWVTAFFSESLLVSVKFGLAKTWYIVTFYFLSIILLRKQGFERRIFKIVLLPLVIVTIIILWRHYGEGFSFESANFVMAPFFRNHVTSAAMMSVFLPFVLYLLVTTKGFLPRMFYMLSILVLIAGIYFSYTRAAHISVLLSLLAWPMMHFRLTRWAVVLGLAAGLWFVSSMLENNAYMEYAPDFETTVSHTTFEDLVSATYKGKDISTMERVYRWVAAMHMVADKPALGFGPGNFYNFYKHYTVTNFRTYVSDNPERSGVHCYYLMVLVEQGFLGLLLFLGLIVVALIKLEQLYHRSKGKGERWLIIAVTMSLTVIILFQLINDLIETDKVGAFFFLLLALITVLDIRQKGGSIISSDTLAEN